MTKIFLRGFLVAGLALFLGFAAACRPSANSADTRTAYQAVAAAPLAPTWTLTDLDGKSVSSADFKGKVVVVDFWATWCGPCVHELPGYIELQKKLGPQGFTLVGLSLDEISPAQVKKFAAQKGINYPIVMAGAEQVAAFGNFEGIPATFVIDREGKLRFEKHGAAPIEDLEKTVKNLL